MPDFKKMTVESLRELARKLLGPGHSRFKSKTDLVRALEAAGEGGPANEPVKPARAASTRTASAPQKAAKVAKEAAKSSREGVRSTVRAGKAPAAAASEGARASAKAAGGQKGGKPLKAAAGAVGAMGRTKRAGTQAPEGLPDPEGYFVARIRGEEAVRDAPHPMTESGADRPYPAWGEGVGAPTYDERLGDLPWGYGDDAFIALPRDPRSLFLYWDYPGETVARAFEGLDHPRAQLWIFVRSQHGWDRLRTIEFALESRGFYVHDLEPGRAYRAEIHAVDRQGRERLVAHPSNEVALPPVGLSPIIDDRFIRIPWDMPLGRLLGPGHPGAPFPDEARALLARLSDWARFSGSTWGGSAGAGGMGGRPSSPTSSPSKPGPAGGGDAR